MVTEPCSVSETCLNLQNLKKEEATWESQLAELTDDEEKTESIRDSLEFCRANATGLADELNQLKGCIEQIINHY